jgi:ribosomal protein L11 methyltransferase
MTVEFLYSISFEIRSDLVDVFAESLEPHLDSVLWSQQEKITNSEVRGLAETKLDKDNINMLVHLTSEVLEIATPKVKFSKIPACNWIIENVKEFPPIKVGRFFIHGADYTETIPYSRIGLRIPAGAAFGSGDHGSTKGCLLALDKIVSTSVRKPIRSALDVGCGSGILAIAMAKRWHIPVLAIDIDPIASQVCKQNSFINGVAGSVRSLSGPGYLHHEIANRRWDLIVCNILARPLTRLAKDLGRHLNPGGWAILSGLLLKDINRIIYAHLLQGIQLHCRIKLGTWATLVLKKPS